MGWLKSALVALASALGIWKAREDRADRQAQQDVGRREAQAENQEGIIDEAQKGNDDRADVGDQSDSDLDDELRRPL